MEFILSLIAHILRQIWPVPFLLIVFLYLCGRFGSKLIGIEKSLVVAIVGIVLTIVVFFARNYIIVPIINHYGIPAEAKVLSSSETMFFDSSFQRQYRYKALYKSSTGEIQEISYWTRSRNIYPQSASSQVIPKSEGYSFNLKYLPIFPKSFIFIASSPRENRECQSIAKEIAEIEIRLELEPDNEEYRSRLEQLVVAQHDQCSN